MLINFAGWDSLCIFANGNHALLPGSADDRAFRRMLSPLKRFGKIVRDNGQTNAHVWYVVIYYYHIRRELLSII